MFCRNMMIVQIVAMNKINAEHVKNNDEHLMELIALKEEMVRAYSSRENLLLSPPPAFCCRLCFCACRCWHQRRHPPVWLAVTDGCRGISHFRPS